MGHNPAPYVIVGMMSCFGGISRAPLAVMLMVAEMTGSLSILTPAMVAVGISWLIVRRNDDTIYRSQLKSRAEAHPRERLLAGLPLLAAFPTTRAMAKGHGWCCRSGWVQTRPGLPWKTLASAVRPWSMRPVALKGSSPGRASRGHVMPGIAPLGELADRGPTVPLELSRLGLWSL